MQALYQWGERKSPPTEQLMASEFLFQSSKKWIGFGVWKFSNWNSVSLLNTAYSKTRFEQSKKSIRCITYRSSGILNMEIRPRLASGQWGAFMKHPSYTTPISTSPIRICFFTLLDYFHSFCKDITVISVWICWKLGSRPNQAQGFQKS